MMDKRKFLIGLLWDVGLPAGVYYGGRALGYDVLPALIAGGAVALVRVAWVAAVRRRLDGVGVLVGASFAVLLVLSLFTGDPRILLARESVLSGASGLLLVGSCLFSRPLIYTLARKVNAAKTADWEERWASQPAFRRHFLMLSAVFGSILLAEATLRVVLIYLLPVDVMANLSPVLHVGGIAVLVGWALWYRKHAMGRVHAR